MPSPRSFMPGGFLAFTARHWCFLSLLALAALTVLSLLPMPEQDTVQGNDKVLHVVAWMLAIGPAALALGRRVPGVVVLFLVWGIAIEWLQPLSGRSREIADVVANASGLALGTLLGIALRQWKD